MWKQETRTSSGDSSENIPFDTADLALSDSIIDYRPNTKVHSPQKDADGDRPDEKYQYRAILYIQMETFVVRT